MRFNFPDMRTFLTARDRKPETYARFNLSPGGACSLLHVSRQRVSQLISTPAVDAAVMDDGYVLLDYAQVLAYRKKQRKAAANVVDIVKRTG